jgi:hypothetical protein
VQALNLYNSPEKGEFWECADPLQRGAGNTGNALQTSVFLHPEVSDSVELDNDNGITRRASENPKGFWRSIPDREHNSRVWTANAKGGDQKMPMRGMVTGTPQWFSDEAANPPERKFPSNLADDALEAIDIQEAAQVDESRSIGCGVCAYHCPTGAIKLERTGRRLVLVPPPKAAQH